MPTTRPDDDMPTLTASRVTRLFTFLNLVAGTPRMRSVILKKLKIDVRSFYRDLEVLRTLDIVITTEGERYSLTTPLSDALARLPFPDPCLSFQEALTLANGRTDAHKKLKARLSNFNGLNLPNGGTN